MNKIHINKISEINKDKLLNFYQKSFDFEKSVLENYEWRYRSGYSNYDSLALMVDNQICGHAGLRPVNLKINEKVQPVIWFTDFFISPGYRSKGYGKILTEAWMKICPIQITLCNNESLRILDLRYTQIKGGRNGDENFVIHNETFEDAVELTHLYIDSGNLLQDKPIESDAFLFNSKLFHKTDDFSFKNSYIHRRINVTLLFD